MSQTEQLFRNIIV